MARLYRCSESIRLFFCRMTMHGNLMAAAILTASDSAYAAYAANRLLESPFGIKEIFGDSAFTDWKDHYRQRIAELAAAIGEGEPNLFSAQIDWAQSAFQSRQVPIEVLRQSLICLSDVLFEELPESCRQEPVDYISLALESLETTSDGPEELKPDSKTSRMSLNYITMILEGDGQSAIELVVQALQEGMPVLAIYENVLLAAQQEVGRMWHLGDLSISEEHYVTATTIRAMGVLNYLSERQPKNGRTVVSAAVSGNIHDIGVRAVSDFFDLAGWRAVCLGGDTPAEDIAMAVGTFEADLLLVSAALTVQLKSVRDTIERIRQERDCKIMVGGMAFSGSPNIWRQMGADGFSTSISESIETGHRLVS